MTTTPLSPRRTKLPDTDAYETAIYNGVKALLYKQALEASKNSGLPFDEMRAEADVLFVTALRRFDDERGAKFSTFLTSLTHNGLIDYGNSMAKHEGYKKKVKAIDEATGEEIEKDEWILRRVRPTLTQEGEEISPFEGQADEAAARRYNLIDELLSISADAAKVASLVLFGLASDLGKLTIMLRDRLGWDKERINNAFNVMRTTVNAW